MKKSELQKLIREEVSKALKESVLITEDWKTTIAKAVIKKGKNKFNQYTFDVVDNGKVLATYTPERNFVEIHTPEALEFFKHTFKELGIRPIEDKEGGEGKITSYTLKNAGNMKLLKSIMNMSKSKIVVEGLDSKPIKSFKVTDLAKIFAKIGFPTTKVEVYDNVSAGPTLSIEFKNTLADENEFIDAYTDFQFDNGALGSWLPDIESAYHKGGNKWEFQMQK